MRSVETARVRGHLSGEHFSVDGTLIHALAGHKRFVSRTKSDDDSPPDCGAGSHENWHGEKRGNDTHESSTDSQAGPFRRSRGTGAMLCYMGHVLTDNRHALVVNAQVTQANGTAERETTAEMLADAAQFAETSTTVGADKNHDTAGFVATFCAHGVTPHVAQTTAARAVRLSTGAQLAGLAMPSVSASANALSRSSAGARRLAGFGRQCFGDCNELTSSSS